MDRTELVIFKKEVQRRLTDLTKIFTVSKEGRPFGRNTVIDDLVSGEHRREQHEGGEDGMSATADQHPAEWMLGDRKERFFASDYAPATDISATSRRMNAGVGSDAAPWRNVVLDADLQGHRGGQSRRGQTKAHGEMPWRNALHDADLPVQQYGQARSGRGKMSRGGRGSSDVSHDQDPSILGGSLARSTARQTLAATMALASKHSKVLRSSRPDDTPGTSMQGRTPGKIAPMQRDVASVYRSQREDTEHAVGMQDHEGKASYRGMVPSAHPERAMRAVDATYTSSNARLANTAAIVRGLREGTASAKRRAANEIMASGAGRASAVGDLSPGARKGAIPSDDSARVSRLSQMPLTAAGAALGLEVHTYRGATPSAGGPLDRLVHGSRAESAFGKHVSTDVLGKSGAQEFRSHTTDSVSLGEAPENVFRSPTDDAAAGYRGVIGMNKSAVRPTEVGEDISMRDEIGGMGEVL